MKKEDLSHIASLSRLSFQAEDVEKFTKQLNTVLRYVDQLNELNPILEKENIAPDISEAHSLRLRKDMIKEQHSAKISNNGSFHMSDNQYFVVPKVIDHS